MPENRLVADAFGVVTISLVSLATLLGLLCIYRAIYFLLRIRRRGFLQLGFFNGPWLTRIALILVSIWWGLGEIVRLTLLRGNGRPFADTAWQKKVCEFYIVSDLGFAEPTMFLLFGLLLHASLQRRECGVLSPRWNRKTFGYVAFCSVPVFAAQLALVLANRRIIERSGSFRGTRLVGFFRSTSTTEHSGVCTYPLLSTAVLGLFYALLICYITLVGTRALSLVINKGLRRRVYLLIFSVIVVLPARVLLLGLSVLPQQGHLLFEASVFLAFLVLLSGAVVCISMLVYFPVSDSLALGDLQFTGMEEMLPFDDYYSGDGTSLIASKWSCGGDESSKRDSATELRVSNVASPMVPLSDMMIEY